AFPPAILNNAGNDQPEGVGAVVPDGTSTKSDSYAGPYLVTGWCGMIQALAPAGTAKPVDSSTSLCACASRSGKRYRNATPSFETRTITWTRPFAASLNVKRCSFAR